jgi:putative tricarboxylic transport membrane protein
MTDPTQTPAQGLLPHEEPLPPRVDLYIAAVFLALAIAIVSIALGMPTYHDQLGEIYTAPGLVPGVHGTIIGLLSLWLGLRAIGRGALRHRHGAPMARREGYSNVRLVLAAALCLVFAGGLVSRVPFWLATALFVAGFIVLFEWRPGLAGTARLKTVAAAAAIGVGASIAVVLVFERLFLVRLP